MCVYSTCARCFSACTYVVLCVSVCVFSKALKVSREVIILQLHPSLEHKRLHFHIDFLSLQMEIHTVYQIGPSPSLSPPYRSLTTHKLIVFNLMNESKVGG